MLEVTGQIIARDNGGLWVSADAAACHACGSPCGTNLAALYLATPGEFSTSDEATNEVVIGLGNGTRLSLLWHSLLLPLAGLLLGSWLGSTVGGGDGSVLLGAVVGFVGGLLLCKARRFDVLNVRFGNVKFQADK